MNLRKLGNIVASLLVLMPASWVVAEAPQVGQALPNFYLATLNPQASSTKRVVLNNLVDKPGGGTRALVVVFFDADCQPCQRLLPELNKFYEAHHKEGLAVVGVDSDSQPEKIEQVRRMLADMKITFPVVADRFLALSRRYGIKSFPTLFIADGRGKLRLRQDGFHPEKKPLPSAALLQLLGKARRANSPAPTAL